MEGKVPGHVIVSHGYSRHPATPVIKLTSLLTSSRWGLLTSRTRLIMKRIYVLLEGFVMKGEGTLVDTKLPRDVSDSVSSKKTKVGREAVIRGDIE